MSVSPLARALSAVAPGASVEARGTLAVLTVVEPSAFADAAARARLLEVAAAAGGTHVAVEIADDDVDASRLPRA